MEDAVNGKALVTEVKRLRELLMQHGIDPDSMPELAKPLRMRVIGEEE